MKYSEWLSAWLALYVKPSAKPRTYDRYCHIVKNQLLPALGEYELSDLTAVALQKFVVGLSTEEKSLAANTVNCVISVVQSSLKTAVLAGVVEKQYSANIQRPKIMEKQIECFTLQEQKKIEKYISESRKTKLFGIIFCFYTGLRIGELLALKWSDLDLAKGIMMVTKSCHDSFIDGKCVKVIDTPKTPQSYRVIPIPKQMITTLKALKKESRCEYFVSEKDKSVGNRSYQRTFELLLKKLRIPHHGLHSLRHTFATRAIECGMDVKTLSEILGHKNPTVTLNRYAHSLLEHKTEMMNRLGKLF